MECRSTADTEPECIEIIYINLLTVYLWWTRWSCAHVYASRCPEIVNKNIKSNRNFAFALYDLWENRRCAPAVIPKPLPMISAKTANGKQTKKRKKITLFNQSDEWFRFPQNNINWLTPNYRIKFDCIKLKD